MAITAEITVATALCAANIALLSILTYVWVQNYRKFQAPLIGGLLVFSFVFILENALGIYFFFFTEGLLYGSEQSVQRAVMVLRALQFVAISALVYVTLK